MNKKTFIIAEAGVNHNGDLKIAKLLIDEAKKANVDAVKFQIFKPALMATKTAPKAAYQISKVDTSVSQLEMLSSLALSYDEFKILKQYTESSGLIFMCTAFDIESAEFLNILGLRIFKIPSGEITNLPLLRKIASFNKEIILSTGMSTLEEIKSAIEVIFNGGTQLDKITVMHANTEYPTPFQDVNLLAMTMLGKTLKLPYGYSDHTPGIEVPIAAVALGASCIEKHFTLDKNMQGPDHKASINPDELCLMCSSIRNIEIALGNSKKIVTQSELKNLTIARKSIVAKKNIQKGDIFTDENICTKRPGSGISPMLWDKVLGEKAVKDFLEDEMISL